MAGPNEINPDPNGRYNVTMQGKDKRVYVSGVDARNYRVVDLGGTPDLSGVAWPGGQQPAGITWVANFKVQPRPNTPAQARVTFNITVGDPSRTYYVVHDQTVETINPGTNSKQITTDDPAVGWT